MNRDVEHRLQSACVKWFRYQYPNELIFAVPNGGKREQKKVRTSKGWVTYSPTAVKLKEEGAMAGVADLIIVSHKGVLFVEMKTLKGRQSDTQKEFQKKVEGLGYIYIICKTFEQFVSKIKTFL